MKRFKITIEEAKPKSEGDRYDSWEEIYTQQVDTLDISSVTQIVNRTPPPAFNDDEDD